MHMLKPLRSPLAAAAVALGLALLIAACSSSSDEPASTPTPTSGPLLPIIVSEATPVQAIFDQLPDAEVQCLRDALGEIAFAELAEAFLADDLIIGWETDELAECLGDESLARILLGTFVGAFGGSSADTNECLLASLAGVDLRSMLFGQGDGPDDPALFLGLLLCVDDQEAQQLDLMEFFGADGPTVAQMRCVAGQVDPALLSQFFQVDIGETLPAPEMLEAMLACGIDVGGHEGGEGPDAEQVGCLLDALGAEALAALGSEDYMPTPAEMEALAACGIDVGDHEGGEGPDSEQAQCLLDSIGAAAIEELRSGSRNPTSAELLALRTCGAAPGSSVP